jgi:hypothetical protein
MIKTKMADRQVVFMKNDTIKEVKELQPKGTIA